MKKTSLLILFFVAVISANAQTKKTEADSLKFESAKKQLNTFLTALTAVGMDSVFLGSPKTILAPDDQAFAKLSAGMLDSLLKPANKVTVENQAALVWLLMGHIISRKLSAQDITKQIHENNGQVVFTTGSGIKLMAKINANRNIVLMDERGNKFIVKQFDIPDGNAVIFIINSVILPDKTKPIKIVLK